MNALPPEWPNALPESVNADVQDPVTRLEKLRVQNAKSGTASTNYISVKYPHKLVTDSHKLLRKVNSAKDRDTESNLLVVDVLL